jgi:hypothetical protein
MRLLQNGNFVSVRFSNPDFVNKIHTNSSSTTVQTLFSSIVSAAMSANLAFGVKKLGLGEMTNEMHL